MKIQLIDEWKQCWRWFSSWALIIAGAIPSVWVELPSDLKSAIPVDIMSTVTTVVAACGLIGRVVQQGKNNGVDNS
ncbi:hypothetical protein VSX61_22185 [Brenneria populi subsp. brevivirga]|uniref:DUF7940 domain-containing protein n=1 Tax=Brenneria populi TaxID=1505588 RepID=UPI002E18F87C|nr:hypothetical protein [Brenneria populi subsp. brevivirga]